MTNKVYDLTTAGVMRCEQHPLARPCICGKLWGLDFALRHYAVCLCGKTLSILPVGNGAWFVQHGPNPEHRSPVYSGGSLVAVCDWIDSVCLKARLEDNR